MRLSLAVAGAGEHECRARCTSAELVRMETTPFGDYRSDARRWITIFDTQFYPDTLESALAKYAPVLRSFQQLADEARNSTDLLRDIQAAPKEVRVQLLRVFRKYVSPDTPVEMLKRVGKTEELITDFGDRFRPIGEVRLKLIERPSPDEALIALLAEYGERGKKGYELTEAFFLWFKAAFGEQGWTVVGPLGAGRDIDLTDVIAGYPTPTPADFVISDPDRRVRVIGFARYDSDRGVRRRTTESVEMSDGFARSSGSSLPRACFQSRSCF